MRLTSIATAIAASLVLTACTMGGGGGAQPQPTPSDPLEASPSAYGQRILPTLCDVQVKEQILLDEISAPTPSVALPQSISDAASASSTAGMLIASTNYEWPSSAATELDALADALYARDRALLAVLEAGPPIDAASVAQPADFEAATLAARRAVELPETMTGGCMTSP